MAVSMAKVNIEAVQLEITWRRKKRMILLPALT